MDNPRHDDDCGVSILADSDYGSLLDHLPGMAYRCRWDGDWTMDYVSRGALALLGHPPEDLVGNRKVTWGHLILSDDLAEVSKAVRTATKDRKPFQCVYRLALPGGVEKWVIEDGRVISDKSAYPHILEGFITDITEQKAHENDLKEQREQSRQVVERARDGFLSIDLTGKIRDWNLQAATTFGWPRDEIIGKDLAETLIPENRREGHNKGFGQLLETQATHIVLNANITGLRRNGREFPAELTIWPCRHGENRFFNAFVHDLSERNAMTAQLSEAEHSLKQLMRNDPLTGLANRKALDDELVRATSFARRWKQPLTLVLVDLDEFEHLNEKFGHSGGEQVIVSFAELLKTSCRKEDLVARLEEGRFALLLANTDVQPASVLTERLQKKIAKTDWQVDSDLRASFGTAKFMAEDDPAAFIDRASQALQHAQGAGVNQIASLEEDAEPVALADPS